MFIIFYFLRAVFMLGSSFSYTNTSDYYVQPRLTDILSNTDPIKNERKK